MRIKPFLSRLLAILLIVTIGLMGCSASPVGLSGDYRQDTMTVIESLTTAIELSADDSNKQERQTIARQQINDYISRYRRDERFAGLRSFTTMQTALNSVAGFYGTYGTNRSFPEKLKSRLKDEFAQAQLSLERGS